MKKDNLKRIAITADEKTLELCDLMVKDGEAKKQKQTDLQGSQILLCVSEP